MAAEPSPDLENSDSLDAGPSQDAHNESVMSGQDVDLGHLISFANLENMMKHIIRKFKAIELRESAIDQTTAVLKRDIEARATYQSLENTSKELKEKISNQEHKIEEQTNKLQDLQENLDRTRGRCDELEKRIEVAFKEKAVQDRLLRDLQDNLQDKVGIAELNMFETKFAGYTTKLEHQEVLASLSHYTLTENTERIAETLRVMGTRFDDYTRTAAIQQQFQETRDWVSDELQHYAKVQPVQTYVDDLSRQIRESNVKFEGGHGVLEDKLRALSDRISSVYTEFTYEIQQRALEPDLQTLRQELKKYLIALDFQIFQADCVPKLNYCVKSLKAFQEHLNNQDAAISRVDEILLDKANKYDVLVTNSRIDRAFDKEKAMAEFQSMYERLDWMKGYLESYVENEASRLEKYKPPDYKAIFDEIRTRIDLKADKADLVEIYQVKANRIDAEDLSKLQELIHRQLEYLALTTHGLAKLSLDEKKVGDSKTLRAQQKGQVLMQAEALWHWIIHNNAPPNLESLRPALDKKVKVASEPNSPYQTEDQDKLEKKRNQQSQRGVSLPTMTR
jgi:hypothetical protein